MRRITFLWIIWIIISVMLAVCNFIMLVKYITWYGNDPIIEYGVPLLGALIFILNLWCVGRAEYYHRLRR